MSYEALVTRIRVRRHPNADRIQLGLVHGHQVVVGLDTHDDELGVFFPSDGRLSRSFAEANDLVPRYNEEGKKINNTFFCDRLRVRAQKFRGAKSDGYWVPMSYLDKWAFYIAEGDERDRLLGAIAELKPGDSLSNLLGHSLCEKYYSPKTVAAMANASQKMKKETEGFAQHVDTKQFRYAYDQIPVGSLLTITEKLHGTSGRYANLPVEEKPTSKWQRLVDWIQRVLAGLIGLEVHSEEYAILTGSRRVELQRDSKGFYDDVNFRFRIADYLKDNLHPGEVLYGEIVGYVGPGVPIMATHHLGKLDDKTKKEMMKSYPETIIYTYGCNDGESRFFVYRITKVDSEGNVVELSHEQMASRATQLGFKPVPFMEKLVYKGDSDKLLKQVRELSERPSTLDHRHISEGVVVRVDTPLGETYFLKEKNHTFRVLEGIAKADDDQPDLEEIS